MDNPVAKMVESEFRCDQQTHQPRLLHEAHSNSTEYSTFHASRSDTEAITSKFHIISRLLPKFSKILRSQSRAFGLIQ